MKNFTVVRPGVGQVRWLRPVDVTYLQLDRIVNIQQGVCGGGGGGGDCLAWSKVGVCVWGGGAGSVLARGRV